MNDILFKLVPNWSIYLYFELPLPIFLFRQFSVKEKARHSEKRKIEIGRAGLASIDNGVRYLLATVLFCVFCMDTESRVEFHVQDVVELVSYLG